MTLLSILTILKWLLIAAGVIVLVLILAVFIMIWCWEPLDGLDNIPETIPAQSKTFICQGCQHTIDVLYCLKTRGYCYICDPHLTDEETWDLLSDKNIK